MATIAQKRLEARVRELSVASGTEALAAVWLFVSGFLFLGGDAPFLINNIICGVMVAPMAFGVFARWRVSWLTALIGAWVIVSPVVLGFTDNEVATWNNVITGASILLLSAWSGSTAAGVQHADNIRG